MLSKNQASHIRSLKIKKFREEHGQFVAEGGRLVTDLLNSSFTVLSIYADEDWLAGNRSLLEKRNVPCIPVTAGEMERITALATPGPALAVVGIPATPQPGELSTLGGNGRLFLALDDIRDPGNLGTILRVADWFGIDAVLCSAATVDLYNPKVVQATMGSIARVKVFDGDLPGMIATLSEGGHHDRSHPPRQGPRTLTVYGSFLDGESLYSQDLHRGGVIVIGNESRGVSPDLLPLISHRLLVPSFGESGRPRAESLNASVATAVICAEFRRQQSNKSMQ